MLEDRVTDIKLLTLLNDYYNAQKNVVYTMIWAMKEFRKGHDDVSLAYLFAWCEAKDERSRVWKKFNSEFPRATMLKEGLDV